MKFVLNILLAIVLSQVCLASSALSPQEMREAAIRLLKTFETKDLNGLVNVNPDKYIQHNLRMKSGLEALKDKISGLKPGAKMRSVRSIVDGDYVVLQSEYQASQKMVLFDVFRFENGKIVEHWDNIEVEADRPNVSGHTQLDGQTEVKDIDKTETNKDLLKRYFDQVVIGGHRELAPKFRDQFVQHNPLGEDNKSGAQATSGPFAKPGFVYRVDRVHMILGEGNFVLVVNEGVFDNKPVSFYDFYRVENAKIVEHWDVIEEIPPKEKWKNYNGKF